MQVDTLNLVVFLPLEFLQTQKQFEAKPIRQHKGKDSVSAGV